MKTAFVSALSIVAAATALLTTSVASADTTCKPRLIEKQTSFPLSSQIRGQEGTVYMNIVINENGRAQRADLERPAAIASWIVRPRAAPSTTGCSTSPRASARICP